MAQKPKEGNSASATISQIITEQEQIEEKIVKTCSICLEQLGFSMTKPCPPFPPKPIVFPLVIDTHKIVHLQCTHSFHYICLQKWFSKSSSCPLCRRQAYQPMLLPQRVMDDWGSPTPPRIITGEQAVIMHLVHKAAKRQNSLYWWNIYGDILPNILGRDSPV